MKSGTGSILFEPWDYLVVTASNDRQGEAYESQVALRRKLGLLHGVREVLVIPDPEGRRVGSGGSTIHCLLTVLNKERARMSETERAGFSAAEHLSRLRLLIVHAGGDSKRLPVYNACGKIFVPVPGEADGALTPTLFDRALPIYMALPRPEGGGGQMVIASGDVLLGFDPSLVRFAANGITGLGCLATPEQAAHHGVYCTGNGAVRRFLQKPSAEEQRTRGAVDRYGRSVLDIGIMSFDGAASARLLEVCGVRPDADGQLAWDGPGVTSVLTHGLDIYREIACALGADTTAPEYIVEVRHSGCALAEKELKRIHATLQDIPFHVQTLKHCPFLHFGTLRQLVESGLDLLRLDRGITEPGTLLSLGNRIGAGGAIAGTASRVEGCHINAPLTLAGNNVLAGLDVATSLTLPAYTCLDVLEGRDRTDAKVWFTRIYHMGDDFKGRTLWRHPIDELLHLAGAAPETIWATDVPLSARDIWNARVFPAGKSPQDYHRWLWLADPEAATPEQWAAWRNADRYSLAEIALRTDQAAFHARRMRLRAAVVMETLPRLFRNDSGFSAADLAQVLRHVPGDIPWLDCLHREIALRDDTNAQESEGHGLEAARILHTLATAIERLTAEDPGFAERLQAQRDEESGLRKTFAPPMDCIAPNWPDRAKAGAFERIGRAIAASAPPCPATPRNTLRQDEIVWGRAPARLDLAGGWSDTPPYTLEHGGCVLNAAVTLNGQPPIQAYARIVPEPVIRIASIDFSVREEIAGLDQLLDYRNPGSGFALPKAALALSGFHPELAPWRAGTTLREMLTSFGGGIELTTFAAIPGGSGLGTSSIMGAVIFSVIQRVLGKPLTPVELFHAVLRLEQELTTGGGWQDQIGGAVGGAKIITTAPGLIPAPTIHFVPGEVLKPAQHGGCALLYYTGITRLAKNILQHVVGGWLDRDRANAATLRAIHQSPKTTAETMARRDTAAFGAALDTAWTLKKRLDPGASTPEIEEIIARIRPHLHGAKIMGAGGGGFVLMIAKTPQDAETIQEILTKHPPNHRARFFDFAICPNGLVVTAC